jgi:hypothetical protein
MSRTLGAWDKNDAENIQGVSSKHPHRACGSDKNKNRQQEKSMRR